MIIFWKIGTLARVLVSKVRAAINVRFQGRARRPKLIWTDRGKGFYATNTGRITEQYQRALDEHGFDAMFGADASMQPGKLQELMLHETAVAWMRLRLARTVPAKAWKESRKAYTARLKGCCEEINRDLSVAGLCRNLLPRVAACIQAKGGRIRQ